MAHHELKYFRNDPYMTPNNYDITFNESEIPTNIPKENGYDLERRLQKLIPLTNFIHLNFNPNTLASNNQITISAHAKINNTRVDFL